ncbi:hypothetical protein Tco_0411346 [Tanacetum coccineum]
MSTPVFDPYEAIKQAYLDGTDIESEPFEDLIDTETPESPLAIAPPISLSESTPLVLVPILRRTARMAVRVPHAMSSSLSASMEEVAAMSESVFLEDSEEDDDEEEDEDPAAKDEGLTVGIEGLSMDDEGYGLDDESRGIDDEGHSVESDGLGLEEEEEVVPGATPAVVETEGFLTELGAQVQMQWGVDWSLEYEQERVAVTFGAIWRPVFALEAWAENRDVRLQLAKERRARLELSEVIDGMRRGFWNGLPRMGRAEMVDQARFAWGFLSVFSNANSDRVAITSRTRSYPDTRLRQ